MSRLFALFTIILGVAAFSIPVFGQDSGINKAAYQKKLFNLMDANDDGKVTETEFALGVLWGDFQKCDTNNDGKISQAEYNAYPDTSFAFYQLRPRGKDHFTFEDLTTNKHMIRYMHREWKLLLSELGVDKNARHITMANLPEISN